MLTERLVKVAARAGVRRFVQLSTVQVYGFERPPLPIDEAWSCHASYPFNLVAQQREAAVRAAVADSGMELAVARPVNTFGRRDKTLADILQLHRKGYMVVFGDGNNAFSCIDTRDLGRAMVLLGQTPKLAHDTYLISGCDTSWRELKQTLDRYTGRRARLLCIPARWAKSLARVAAAVTPWSVDLKLTPFAVAVMSTQTLFDDRRIRSLGFQPRYGVADMVADFLRE